MFIVIVIGLIIIVNVLTKKTNYKIFGNAYIKNQQTQDSNYAFSPVMYNQSLQKLATDVIKEELKEHDFKVTDSIPTVEIRKSVIALIYGVLLFVAGVLYLFRVSIAGAGFIWVVSTILFLVAISKVNMYGMLYKEFNARPDENMEFIISSFIQNKTNRVVFTVARLAVIFFAFVVPFMLFGTPKLYYEKVDGGYGIRFYAGNDFPEEVVIPDTYNGEPIVNIRGNVFKGCKGIKKIVLPNSLKTINGHAFENTPDLEEVVLPESLESIGAYAFNKSGIKTINIPSGVKEIEAYTFANDPNLTKVTGTESIDRIGTYAFYNDISLQELEGIRVKAIAAHSFEESGIKTLVLEEGLFEIPAFAFTGSKIEKIAFPSTIKKVAESAFENSELQEVYMNEGLTEISESAFRHTDLKTVVIPDTVERISAHAFRECSLLKSVTLPSKITEIRTSTFRETGLVSVNIPEGVTSIGENAFSSCHDLSVVIIPKSLQSIGEKAFRYDSSLRSLTIPRGTTIGKKAFEGCPAGTNLSYYK